MVVEERRAEPTKRQTMSDDRGERERFEDWFRSGDRRIWRSLCAGWG